MKAEKHLVERIFLLHKKDSKELARHLAFRDYLRNNRQAAIEYEDLKRNLALTAKDRSSYTSGKTEFINKILDLQ